MLVETQACARAPYPSKSYILDENDMFIWFSPEWNQEFQSVFAPEPYDVRTYLGQNFFNLLDGASIRLLYRCVFQRVRHAHGDPLILTLRCDLFPLKRLMSQELWRESENHIKVHLAYIHNEDLSMNTAVRTLPDDVPLKMCSWCQSIFDRESQQWRPLVEALGFLPILHSDKTPPLSHGCCPSCFQHIRGKLNEYSRGG